MTTTTPDMSERRQLQGLAYRLLGSWAEGEDAVQEAFARWHALSPAQQDAIASPGAWLTTVTSRICLDVLGSARARRERYVGEWIPEPLPGGPAELAGAGTGTAAAAGTAAGTAASPLVDGLAAAGTAAADALDPAERVTLDESLSMAFLVVLDAMTPAERVAFILHDVFRYSFAEVADIVGRTPGACRQLASSARRRIRNARPASPAAVPTDGQRACLVRSFKRAWETRDIGALLALLDPDASFVADGGGLAPAALHPIEGRDNIARSCVEIAAQAEGVTFHERTVNGQPGLIAQLDGVTVTVLAFDVAADRITRIWAVRNPRKLQPWLTT